MQKTEEILDFLNRPRAYPPTVREIGAAVGLRSSATVYTYLNKLESAGLIKRQRGCPRCITVVNRS